MTSTAKTRALLQLIRFDKPIGTLLLLWPTLWALWIAAQGAPDLGLLPTDFRDTIKSVGPRLVYSAETYDSVTLVALAAQAAESTDPRAIANMLPQVSGGGTPCGSFAACKELLLDVLCDL